MQPSRHPAQARSRYSPLWVLGGAVVIASLLIICSLGSLWLTRARSEQVAPATAILEVILAPTLAASAVPVMEGDGTLPAPPAGVIAIDAFVQITNTSGDGLRLRDQPGLAGRVLFVGSEAEVFRVTDGPRELDGYTWWFLVGPFDETRQGWAVSNYLQVVQNP